VLCYCWSVHETLDLDGPLGEVDLEPSCDRNKLLGSWVPADWTCVGSCDDGATCGVWCTTHSRHPWLVLCPANDRELAELHPRYDNDKSPSIADPDS